MIIQSHDPGFAALGIVVIEWSPQVRRLIYHDTIKTAPELHDSDRWALLIAGLRRANHYRGIVDRYACEEMSGVRAGQNRAGKSNSRADTLSQCVGAIRATCYPSPLYLIGSRSSYAAVGSIIKARPGETRGEHERRQKATTERQVRLLLRIPPEVALTEHEADACAHAIGVATGKGGVG